MNKKQKIIYISVAFTAIISASFIWVFFIRSSSLENQSNEHQATAQYAEDVLDTINLLRSINIDTGFFERPIYTQLIDISVLVKKVTPKGRSNPFLPF